MTIIDGRRLIRMNDRYADHLLGTSRLPVDVDPDGGTGRARYDPHFRRCHRMESAHMALHDGHVVHVRRKRYLPHPVRHLQPSHPQRVVPLSQLESEELADETLLH